MHASIIATIDPEAITEGSGYVHLGTIDGLAYVHLAPYADPVRVFFPNGDLTRPQVLGPDEPDPTAEGIIAIAETPRPAWAVDAVTIYDSTPEPFRWAEFADAHPELGASPGNDVDGNPLPSALMPHQWAGE